MLALALGPLAGASRSRRSDAGPRRRRAAALFEELVGDLADRGTTVFLTTHDLAGFEGIATHVGILKQGKLVLDAEMEALKARFRRIRYANRQTETRTEFGNELDEFEAVKVQVRGWGIDAIVSNFDAAGLRALPRARRRRQRRGRGDVAGGDLHRRRGRRKGRGSMNGILAVLRREVAERRLVFAAAAFASLVALAVPIARGLSGVEAADARTLMAVILSAASGAGIAIVLGATILAPRIADRRIAFDLARPLSAFALWSGRVLAAVLLATASASIVLVPALLLGGSTLGNDLPFSIPVGGLLFLGAVVGLFALLHAVAVAVASRSGRIALDAVLALLVGYGAAAAFARLPRFMAAEPFRIACVAFAVAAIVAALVAGYASLARGRTDIQAAHRALSFVLWVGLGAAAFGVNAYAWWVMAAGPGNLGAYFDVTPAPAGGWLVAGGSARGAQATFLLDTAGGRSARAPVVDWQAPHFSMDGRHAVWVEGRDQGGPVAVWTWNLADRDASPVRTQLLLRAIPISSFSRTTALGWRSPGKAFCRSTSSRLRARSPRSASTHPESCGRCSSATSAFASTTPAGPNSLHWRSPSSTLRRRLSRRREPQRRRPVRSISRPIAPGTVSS